jgi:hypothetical protein
MRATTYEEVASGALNNPEQRFAKAIDLTRQGLQLLVDNGIIIGGTIFGSAVSQDPEQPPDIDPLSDLDAIVVAPSWDPSHATQPYRRLHWLSRDVRAETAVALELSYLSRDMAASGNHTYSNSMLAWLRYSTEEYPDMTVGEAPADIFRPSFQDPVDATSVRLASMYGNLLKASQSAHSQLPWALSVAHVAARRSIDTLREIDPLNSLRLPPPLSLHYTKAEVAATAIAVYGPRDRQIAWHVQELSLIKQGYLGFLQTVAAKSLATEEQYDATIDEMAADAVPKAADLIGRMHRQFNLMSWQVLAADR